MRLLCINPNTTAAMTEKVVVSLRPHLPVAAEIVPATGRFGAPYISSRATFAIGGHAALDVLAQHGSTPFDAVLLACFGDPALMALREISDVPVIGMAEASMHLAAREAGQFSIVTGGRLWEPMLRELAIVLGLTDKMVSIRAIEATGGDIFRNPAAARQALLAAITECGRDGAQRVILGGAGLAGLADDLRSASPLPLIDCVEALATMGIAEIACDRSNGRSARPSPRAIDLAASGWL